MHWRLPFDAVLIVLQLALYVYEVCALWMWRDRDGVRQRNPLVWFAVATSEHLFMLVIVLQDMFIISERAFPCYLVMIASMQVIPGVMWLTTITMWHVTFAFKPELKTRRNQFIVRPRFYWGVAAGMLVVLAGVSLIFLFAFPDRWMSSSSVINHCIIFHEWWFYFPVSGCLLSFVLQAGKHMLDVEDYFGIARGVRNIAPFAAVTAIPDVCNILWWCGVLHRDWWDWHAFPITFAWVICTFGMHVSLAWQLWRMGNNRYTTGQSRRVRPVRVKARGSGGALVEGKAEGSFMQPSTQQSTSLDSTDLEMGQLDAADSLDLDLTQPLHRALLAAIWRSDTPPSLAAVLAVPGLSERMFLHSRKLLSAENMHYLNTMRLFQLDFPGLQDDSVPTLTHVRLDHALTLDEQTGAPVPPAQLPPSDSELVRLALPRFIKLREAFLSPSSPHELNVSGSLRREWLASLASVEASIQRDGNASLLESSSLLLSMRRVSAEVQLLVETNLFVSFLGSRPFVDAAKQLRSTYPHTLLHDFEPHANKVANEYEVLTPVTTCTPLSLPCPAGRRSRLRAEKGVDSPLHLPSSPSRLTIGGATPIADHSHRNAAADTPVLMHLLPSAATHSDRSHFVDPSLHDPVSAGAALAGAASPVGGDASPSASLDMQTE